MATTLTNSAASIAPAIVKRLGSRRVLLGALALALIGAGLAWQWSWLAAIGVAPLLISAAPCVACARSACACTACATALEVQRRTELHRTLHLSKRPDMTVANKLSIAAFAAAFGALIAPAFAQNGSSDTQAHPDHGMSMGHMGQGMMGGGMMSGRMMADCADMMQSMNNGSDGRPNSQWQKRPPGASDNGG